MPKVMRQGRFTFTGVSDSYRILCVCEQGDPVFVQLASGIGPGP